MTDLVVRPLEAGETALFHQLDEPAIVGMAAFGRDYDEFIANRQYRPEWTWVALRDGEVVARAAWWGGPDDAEPKTLDWFDFTEPDAGAAILRATPFTDTEYCLVLPAGWRDDPQTHRAGQARIDAALSGGMKPLVERLRYTWTPADGLPDRPGRLVFREQPDDEVILDAFRRIIQGSLDARDIAGIKRVGLEAAARNMLDEMKWFPGPREWWRLAYTPAGDLVGTTMPSRNYAYPVVGFIGVVPEQRGHGYSYDLVVECTHLLVEQGFDKITAETDATNFPMAANFKRAGYPITQERVFMNF